MKVKFGGEYGKVTQKKKINTCCSFKAYQFLSLTSCSYYAPMTLVQLVFFLNQVPLAIIQFS